MENTVKVRITECWRDGLKVYAAKNKTSIREILDGLSEQFLKKEKRKRENS